MSIERYITFVTRTRQDLEEVGDLLQTANACLTSPVGPMAHASALLGIEQSLHIMQVNIELLREREEWHGKTTHRV